MDIQALKAEIGDPAYADLTPTEIADQLNLPIGTVKTQIHRAREQLCRYITDHNDRQL